MEIKVSDKERKVLEFLARDYRFEANCFYFRTIAKGTRFTIKESRRIVRSLARKGLAEYQRGLFDDGGNVAGSGYSATERGAIYIYPCSVCNNAIGDYSEDKCVVCFDKK